jgi:glucose-1-phosphatase
MPKPEFLYFDLGKVLLAFDHARMLRQMAEVAGVTVEAVRDALMPRGEPTVGDAQWRLEAGTLSVDGYYEHLCESLGKRPPREELWLAASDIFAPIEASMDLLERLHTAGHRLGLLSNTSPVHWEFFMDGRFPTLARVFEIPLGSFHAGTMKPEPAIYHFAAQKAGVAPERVFFTDDRAENVEGARVCGLDAVLFTDTAQLERDLRVRGLEF